MQKKHKCEICGVEKLYKPSHLKRIKHCLCSRKCTGVHQSRIVGKKHPNWKGGYTHDAQGYVKYNIGGKQVLEHRRIMENYLGKKLGPRQQVHHKNGDKTDNNINNLEVMDIREHSRMETTKRHKSGKFYNYKLIH